MIEIRRTEEFAKWMKRLKDLRAKARINRYFERIQRGGTIAGDYKLVRPRIIEVRFHFGQGYRVYLTQEGQTLLILLLGGDKSSQSRDIDKAEELAERWRKGEAYEDKEI